MPRKAAEPAAEPLEQAAGPPIIAETDVERRLEEELSAMAQPPPQAAEGDPDGTLSENTGTAADQAGEEADAEPFLRPPRRRRTPRRAAEEAAPPAPEEQEPAEEAPKTAAPPPAARRRAAPRGARVVTIDEQGSVETPDDKARSDLIDLVESQKSGRILTGTLQGVERNPDNPDLITAVLYHGDFKVIIPMAEAISPPRDFRDRKPSEVMHYLLMKRLGAEFDFIVKGVDEENRIAAASRMEAMAVKRRLYYNGRLALTEGVTAEARIACVIRTGVFAEIFGVEAFIPLRELSYQRGMDAALLYQPGQRVLVKVLSVERKPDGDISVEASVKQVGENPYEKALRRYTVGNLYVGTVSLVDTNGVYVNLEGGIDCLCLFPRRGRPPRGSRVTIRIKGINYKANRIWGTITHMTTH